MGKSIVKRLRTTLLDWAWTVHGQAPPSQALPHDAWLAAGGQGTAYQVAESLSVTCPARMMRGDVAAIPATIAALSPGYRYLYEREWRGTANVDYPAEHVVALDDGRVFSKLGAVVGSDDTQIIDISGAAFEGLYETSLVHSGRLPKPRRVRGSVAVLACGLSQRNYYHWIVEVLPRLRMLEAAKLAPDYYFVPVRHRFHRQSLQLLGIDRRRFISARKYTHLQANTLYACTQPRPEMHPRSATYLYQLMASQPWSQTDASQRRNVYVARRPRDPRYVVNEAEVMAALRPWNFKKYYLEDLSVREQIQLFQQADFIVGPHGAGLVNTTFCNSGTRVIEIGTPARASALFYYIAHYRGLNYCNFYGEAVRRSGDESRIRVQARQLASCVDEMLQGRASAA